MFVKRLWRSVKYEEVYLRAYNSVSEARTSLGQYLAFYKADARTRHFTERPPDHVYFNQPLLAAA